MIVGSAYDAKDQRKRSDETTRVYGPRLLWRFGWRLVPAEPVGDPVDVHVHTYPRVAAAGVRSMATRRSGRSYSFHAT